MSHIVGGVSGSKPVTPEVAAHVAELQAAVQAQTNVTYKEFKPISMKTQVVAGVKYFVKVEVAEHEYIHIVFWQKVDKDHTLELLEVHQNKKHDDAF